jgi:hypothetical protein
MNPPSQNTLRPYRRSGHTFLRAGLAALCLAFAVPASAQDPADLRKARAQFQRGIELEQAGNWSEAIQQFREVGQVRMTPQVRFHIAFCEEGLGRLVTALGGYELALAEADAVGADFRAEVETSIGKLRERIPKLFIERGTNAEAALVQIDGIDLGASSVGVEVPLDPGPHTVTASAPGYKPFSQTADLREREVTNVTLVLEPEPVPVRPLGPAGPDQPPPPPPPNRTIPYIVGGIGAGSLIAGGVFFALRQTTLETLEENCPDRLRCDSSNKDAYERLKVYSVVAPVAAGVGIAALGAATTLILLEKKPGQGPQKGVVVTPVAPGSFAGVSVSGRF